jgi:hypothetical protein
VNTKKAEVSAGSLFTRISDYITKTALFDSQWPDAKGEIIYLIRLSTDEKRQESKPWKGIFYLHFYYFDNKPVPVGIGSFTKNEITVDINLVPKEIRELLNQFGFGVIAPVNPNMPFEEIKKEILPHYQQLETDKEKKIKSS